MNVSFPPSVQDRLDAIETDEGITVVEQVQQAVSMWSHLRGVDERRAVGFTVMQVVVRRSIPTEP